ncbi:hypothetical protein AV530_014324 [Patagioenas fasciata monilis]|uniref:Uncharacterized protein n=1 Tax=Patagioenas fasciata monilis TaxID=372326 RepID=A0A1V4KBA3_PATFA|nr:hypothetical protein AV530_014324 [Patagioenas fasciata monilis]
MRRFLSVLKTQHLQAKCVFPVAGPGEASIFTGNSDKPECKQQAERKVIFSPQSTVKSAIMLQILYFRSKNQSP